MGMPPLVRFLDIMSLLGYVSPTCASLPCHASFAAASEFGWARVVLAVHMHRPHEDVVGVGVVHGNAPPCALPRHYVSSGLCLPNMRFPPLSCFLRRSW